MRSSLPWCRFCNLTATSPRRCSLSSSIPYFRMSTSSTRLACQVPFGVCSRSTFLRSSPLATPLFPAIVLSLASSYIFAVSTPPMRSRMPLLTTSG